jgi:hypothetical protein
MLVRFDHVASRIVNANHSIMGAAAKLRVTNSGLGVAIPQPTEGQRIEWP